MASMIQPGFPDPSVDSQQLFRSLLAAMAEPGSIRQLESALPAGHALDRAGRAIALSLCDFETPVWLAPGLLPDADDLRFHCGCPLVREPMEAAILFAHADDTLPALDTLRHGDAMHPEHGATLVIQTRALRNNGGWNLTGPGIADERRLFVDGIPGQWRRQRTTMHARFPVGVDIFFTCGDRLCALPRTTRLRES